MANGFVGTAKFEEEALRAAEEVALRVGEGGRSAKIAGRVRSFQVEGDAVGLVELHEQVDVHGRIAGRRLGVVNVRVVHRRERVEILISILRGDVSIKAIGQNEEIAHVSSAIDARLSGGLKGHATIERAVGGGFVGIEFGEGNTSDAIDLIGHFSIHSVRCLHL